MQNTQPKSKTSLGDAVAWLELTYSNLKVDTLAIFVVIVLLIVLMSIGAFQTSVQQASLFFGVPISTVEPALIDRVMHVVSEYGLAVLIGVCYFSNATQGDKRRELVVDALSIAVGVIVPQLVFHAGWLYTANLLVTTRVPVISSLQVTAINQEWLTVMALSGALLITLTLGWSVIRHGKAASTSANKPTGKPAATPASKNT